MPYQWMPWVFLQISDLLIHRLTTDSTPNSCVASERLRGLRSEAGCAAGADFALWLPAEAAIARFVRCLRKSAGQGCCKDARAGSRDGAVPAVRRSSKPPRQ